MSKKRNFCGPIDDKSTMKVATLTELEKKWCTPEILNEMMADLSLLKKKYIARTMDMEDSEEMVLLIKTYCAAISIEVGKCHGFLETCGEKKKDNKFQLKEMIKVGFNQTFRKGEST